MSSTPSTKPPSVNKGLGIISGSSFFLPEAVKPIDLSASLANFCNSLNAFGFVDLKAAIPGTLLINKDAGPFQSSNINIKSDTAGPVNLWTVAFIKLSNCFCSFILIPYSVGPAKPVLIAASFISSNKVDSPSSIFSKFPPLLLSVLPNIAIPTIVTTPAPIWPVLPIVLCLTSLLTSLNAFFITVLPNAVGKPIKPKAHLVPGIECHNGFWLAAAVGFIITSSTYLAALGSKLSL